MARLKNRSLEEGLPSCTPKTVIARVVATQGAGNYVVCLAPASVAALPPALLPTGAALTPAPSAAASSAPAASEALHVLVALPPKFRTTHFVKVRGLVIVEPFDPQTGGKVWGDIRFVCLAQHLRELRTWPTYPAAWDAPSMGAAGESEPSAAAPDPSASSVPTDAAATAASQVDAWPLQHDSESDMDELWQNTNHMDPDSDSD